MKSKNVQQRTFEVTVPLKLFKIIHLQAQKKFRSVSEEACILLTELLCGTLRTPRQSTIEIFDTLMARSERRENNSTKKTNKSLSTGKLVVLKTNKSKKEE